ncbi:hypothetical protein Ddye_013276 [Dipteronia dyeriana]|uniref:F-box domain-containing protein n=1 Tax=Dipteronia dyeriana TaxID=168575 RepID=A0AAD9X610_9ROSI|nr:hypothetical protein Ddye_013276 [Dipteronia dyeriana]
MADDDLLTGILICLPSKSLPRFKSVSKHWRSLVSGPHFSLRLYPDTHLVSGIILHRSSLLIKHDFVPLIDDKTTIPPFKSLKFVKPSFSFENLTMLSWVAMLFQLLR